MQNRSCKRLQAFAFGFFLLLFVAPAMAEEPLTVKRDPLRHDRYQVVDAKGRIKARIKPDPLRRDRLNITDKAGGRIATIKPDTLRPTTRRTIHTRNGQKIGTIKRDILRPNRYQIIDSRGKPAATIKPDTLRPGRWTIDRLE